MVARIGEESRARVRVPTLGVHKATGQHRIVHLGRSVYLGRDAEVATKRYRAMVGHLLQHGALPEATAEDEAAGPFVVADLVAAFLRAHAGYYVGPGGEQTGELSNYREAFAVLLAKCVRVPVADFRPKRFRELQLAMIAKGWCRNLVNAQVRRIKRCFKWGVTEDMVPPSVHHAALAVEGVRRFRDGARESEPVRPVPDGELRAALPHLPAMVRAMVELQAITGMRVSEVLQMRGGEIDRTGKVWVYAPTRHKTQHFGRERKVAIGPQGQELLRPWLQLDPTAAIFSPRRGEELRSAQRRAARKSKITPSQRARWLASRARVQRGVGEVYTVDAYRRAIARACRAAEVEPWCPARLRHNAADRYRKAFGLEVARCMLGHSDVRTTQLYASFDEAKALDAAERLG